VGRGCADEGAWCSAARRFCVADMQQHSVRACLQCSGGVERFQAGGRGGGKASMCAVLKRHEGRRRGRNWDMAGCAARGAVLGTGSVGRACARARCAGLRARRQLPWPALAGAQRGKRERLPNTGGVACAILLDMLRLFMGQLRVCLNPRSAGSECLSKFACVYSTAWTGVGGQEVKPQHSNVNCRRCSHSSSTSRSSPSTWSPSAS
jgi:hypothetical protein